jgi:hypothetical protein
MRNYIKLFSGVVTYHSGFGGPFESPTIGQTEQDCKDSMQEIADQLTGSGFVVDSQIVSGSSFFLMDKERVAQLLGVYVALTDSLSFLNPPYSDVESPIKQMDWGNNDGNRYTKTGSGRKSQAGNQGMSLFGYLDRLVAKWQADNEPKRWIEWLARLRDIYQRGKITPTQVYAFLFKVDFAASTPKLPA